MKLIETKSARWHRNGVCGIGFVAVVQTYATEDFGPLTMVTTYFPNYDIKGEIVPDHYSTIALERPEITWRGDHFIDAAWQAGKDAAADKSLYL